MILTPAQARIAKDTHRFRVLRCGRRFGKTILMTEEIKGVALSKPSKIAYVATTIQQARDIVWASLLRELQGAIIKVNKARLEIIVQTQTGEESQISLRGWENIETLRGLSFDFLGLDEIAQMKNFWVLWNEVLRPTLLDRKGQAMFSSTPKGYNHFYDLCSRELIDNDYRTFHYTTWDNPWIPREEIEKARATMTPEAFSQEHEATFQKTEGLVYKEFNRRLHTYEELPDGDFERIGGIDFGYRNPAAVLTVYSDGNRFYIDDEWYKKERTDAQVAEYVAGSSFNSVFPDPENPGGIEELRMRGVNTREVVKGRGSVEKGIQQVRELILNNRLKVNEKCINTISEFEMYSYDEDKEDRNEKEDPIKFNDHCLDALRYIVMTYKPKGFLGKEQQTVLNRRRNEQKSTR